MSDTPEDSGREHESRQRKSYAKQQFRNNNIAPLPGVVDRARRDACAGDLRLFFETYFAEAFPLAWSGGHLLVIDSIQRQIREGGSVAIAMPRGSGKTTMIVRAAIWALLFGHSPYVMVVAADAGKAAKLLKGIKDILRFNERLMEDFPEVCWPVRRLEGQAVNANKQHLDGEPTNMDWKANVAQLPTVAGSVSSGSIVEVMGVTSAGRGAQTTLPDGRVIRPTLVLIDDFQTRESAASPLQCKTRLDIIAGDLAGMKGPDQPLAMLAALTVIYPEDGADQLLDRERHPEWRGVRQQMVERWSDEEADPHWDKYAELRLEAIGRDEAPTDADDYYLANRELMDRGAVLSWPERKEADHSALQHAWNLRLRIGDEAFAAEYQNDPEPLDATTERFLSAGEIAARLTGLSKGETEGTVERVVAAIDVQSDHLWYAVVAWGDAFTGTVLDYGAWPDQNRRFYTKRKLPKTLYDRGGEWKDRTEEEALYAAIQELIHHLASRTWRGLDNHDLTVSRILVDEGYQTDVVHRALRGCGERNLVKPAKGMYIRAGGTPMADLVRKAGEPHPRHGHWRERINKNTRRGLRTIHWDANHWRTFLHQRWLTEPGGTGSLALWGTSPVQHQMVGQHCTAMTPRLVTVGSRELVEWINKPTKPDEDLLDCLSMCCVAGSEQGIRDPEGPRKPSRPEREDGGKGRLTLAEYLRRKKKTAG